MVEKEFMKGMLDEMKQLNNHLEFIGECLDEISDDLDACVAGLGPDHDVGAIRICEME